MSISKSKSEALGRAMAEALHECVNTEQRRGVLLAREALLGILADETTGGGISDADWTRYCAFTDAWYRRLDVLEPINPV